MADRGTVRGFAYTLTDANPTSDTFRWTHGPAHVRIGDNATFGGADVDLEIKAADGSWYNFESDMTAVAAATVKTVDMPEADYRFVLNSASSSSVPVEVIRMPVRPH